MAMLAVQAVAADEAGPVIVRGTVTDEAGEPVAGATFALLPRHGASADEQWEVAGRLQADGSYTLEV